MTRMTVEELRQRCIENPDFAARNAQAIRELARKPVVHETTIPLGTQQDAAQTLYDLMRVHAPDLVGWFIREYHFERYRVDLADPQHMIAIEVNGGRWLPGGGKHGGEADRRKIRRLTLAGWRVLEYSTELLANDPLGIIEEIRAALA